MDLLGKMMNVDPHAATEEEKREGTCREFACSITPRWGVNSISPAHLHVRPAPCGPPVCVDELAKPRKIPTRKTLPPLFGGQASPSCVTCGSVRSTRREPFNSTPMAVNPIPFGSPHARTTGRTCGEPNEIKRNTHPKNTTALCRDGSGKARARRWGSAWKPCTSAPSR